MAEKRKYTHHTIPSGESHFSAEKMPVKSASRPFIFLGRTVYGGKIYERGMTYDLTHEEYVNLAHACRPVVEK